jgi:hypothetical protein
MKSRCRAAVSDAIGRQITDAESRNIEDRISDAMRQQALKDPMKWQSTPKFDQLKIAAQDAAKAIVEEANLKRQRLEQSIIAIDNVNNYTETQVAKGYDSNRLEALQREIVRTYDGKKGETSIEDQALGIKANSLGQMSDALLEISPKWLGFVADKRNELALRKAMHGEDVGDAKIMKAAKTIVDQLDLLREQFNAAGGKIGKLYNRGHAHSWSMERFLKLGEDQVINILKSRIDKSKYVHDDGKLYSDSEIDGALKNFYLTVSTDGATEQLGHGSSIKANANSQHREIHFKNGTAATEALSALSDKNLWESILGEIDLMSSNIAIIEKFGPNPDHAIKILLEQYSQEAKLAGHDPQKINALSHDIEKYYNHQAGYNQLPIDKKWLASGAQGLRNLQLFRLGFSPVTALSDTATMFRTVAQGGISKVSAFAQLLKGLNLANQTERRMAMRAGLMLRTLMKDVSRLSIEDSHRGWTGKSGSAFMRATQLNRLNEMQKRSYMVPAMDLIGELTRNVENIKDLEVGDHKFLLNQGITQKTWDIWRQAKLDGWDTGEHTVLTADNIMKIEGVDKLDKIKAAQKLMAVIYSEAEIAVIEPGVRVHALKDDLQRGTIIGELGRSSLTFKSFAAAFLSTHGERGLKGFDTKLGKAEYFAKLVASTWLMGITANWIQDLLNSKNPRNLNPLEGDHGTANLIAGLLKGGGMGPYGDFLFGMATEGGNTLTDMASGPSVSTVARFDDLARGNILKAIAGEDTSDLGGNAIKFFKQFSPTNLWYTKAIFDHLIFEELQEYFSPGYMASVRRKQEKRTGTTYFAEPGIGDVEMPNFKTAIGE